MQNIDLPKLLDKFKSGEISKEEIVLLENWYLQWKPDRLPLSVSEIDKVKDEIWQKIDPSKTQSAQVVSIWRKLMVAGMLLISLSIGSYFLWKNYPTQMQVSTQVNTLKRIKPGKLQATITLANGKKILLVKGLNGNLGREGNESIDVAQDHSISYNRVSSASKLVIYNTLTTTKGEQSPYPLILSDGTKVWLNAASSLHFPTSFYGKERKVTLTGEGYFEVAKNAAMPFKVDVAGKGEVEVLGTHFNVNAYDDESVLKTTLLEGRIKSSFANQFVYLSPGEQSVFEKTNNRLRLKQNVDMEKAVAWKNGVFDFDDDDISNIMRQLGRWYDIKIQYDGRITAQHFTGAVRKQVPLSDVLMMLKKAGGVEFKVDKKNVEVSTK